MDSSDEEWIVLDARNPADSSDDDHGVLALPSSPDCSDLDVSDSDLTDSEAAAASAFTPVAEPPPGEAGQLPGLSQSIAFTPVAEPPPGEAGQLPGLSQSISVEYVMSSEESVASFHGQKLASFVPSFFAQAVVAIWLRHCFTLQWDGGHGGVAGDFRHGYRFGGGWSAMSSPTFLLALTELDRASSCPGIRGRTPEQERKRGVPWTVEEHKLFLLGLNKYGKGDWRNISRNFVHTRTPTQVASHAQKYFIRLSSGGGKDKRRSSIHDITTVHLTDDP